VGVDIQGDLPETVGYPVDFTAGFLLQLGKGVGIHGSPIPERISGWASPAMKAGESPRFEFRDPKRRRRIGEG
jgi:hypothetical protein